MALLFSAVTVTAGEDEIELLVGGIPREYDDLEGWSEFDDLMYFISEETEVSVRAEAYLYGEGESMRASPEEIDDLIRQWTTRPRGCSAIRISMKWTVRSCWPTIWPMKAGRTAASRLSTTNTHWTKTTSQPIG